jgi:hypothetical protein
MLSIAIQAVTRRRPAQTFRNATMTADQLAAFLHHVALPPFKHGVRARLVAECQRDPALGLVARVEAQHTMRTRAQLARTGWWN